MSTKLGEQPDMSPCTLNDSSSRTRLGTGLGRRRQRQWLILVQLLIGLEHRGGKLLTLSLLMTSQFYALEDGLSGFWICIFAELVQGDNFTCSKPPVDFRPKVPLWPDLSCPDQAKTELLF